LGGIRSNSCIVRSVFWSIFGSSVMRERLPATEKTRKDFLRRYGAAMAAWATVERELGTLFAFVTAIKPAMAMQVFYSARSFNGRADMFRAGLIASDRSEAVKAISRAVLRRAKSYNEFRAKLAHDLPNYDYKGGIVLVDGKAQFQSDEVKKKAVDQAITMDQLATIAENFERLGVLISHLWQTVSADKKPSLDIFHERLLRLPTDPRTKGQPPHAATPKPRRPASPG
jgi:hypothetical protein